MKPSEMIRAVREILRNPERWTREADGYGGVEKMGSGDVYRLIRAAAAPRRRLKARQRLLRWRRSFGYHYLENDKGGVGYVHPAAGGGYLAVGRSKSCVADTVREGKRFVERAVRGRAPKARAR